MQGLRAEVRFSWRYLIDVLHGTSPAGVLSITPTTGESEAEWSGRQIREGRGPEAQALLESEFTQLFDRGLLPGIQVLIPVHPHVPPTTDLYRPEYRDAFMYLAEGEDGLEQAVRNTLDWQMEAGRAEHLALLNEFDIKSGPGRHARWWVVPGSLVERVAADETKRWALHHVRVESIHHEVLPVCIDELTRDQIRLAYDHGIHIVGGPQWFVDEILESHETAPFGRDPGVSPFSEVMHKNPEDFHHGPLRMIDDG